jgi:hypothetical protein
MAGNPKDSEWYSTPRTVRKRKGVELTPRTDGQSAEGLALGRGRVTHHGRAHARVEGVTMLFPGELLKAENEWVGFVVRHDGDEACIIRRPNGKEERWNKRTDEQPGFYKQEVHTVADLIEALECLPKDAHISITDGNQSGPPAIYLHGHCA